MTNQEHEQDENGSGQTAEKAEPSSDGQPESKPDRLKQLFSKDLEYVGLSIFAITAIATVIFIAASHFLPLDSGKDPYHHLRSVELLLTLAATGLVVAIVGRAQNPFVLAFGILLIGALIVPSNDIVRFALIASGSDQNYGSFLQSARSGADLEGRSTDVASKILTELGHAGFMETLEPARRKQAIRIVEDEVRKERVITLLEQVRARGALDTLRAMTDNIKGWVYKYGKEEKFIEDLRYLRSEDLVSFAYDDLDTIAITSLGQTVLERTTTVSIVAAAPGAQRSAEPTATSVDHVGQDVCPSDFDRWPDLSKELFSPGGRWMKLEREFNYMQFVAPKTANYRIDVDVIETDSAVDPLLQLFDLTDDGGCKLLAEDDDGGIGVNSRIFLKLEKGAHLIGTAALTPNEGDVLVSIVEIAE
jgi:hypothetical protein